MDHRAIEVLKENYDLRLLKYQLLRSRGDRRVWYIETNRGPFCFKKYNLPLPSYLFSFEGQEYLVKNRVNIPKLISCRRGLPYSLDDKGTVYTLFEWVSGGQPPNLSKKEHVKCCMEALADFHQKGKGFIPSNRKYEISQYRINTDIEERMFNELNGDLYKLMNRLPSSLQSLMKEHHHWMLMRTRAGSKSIKKIMKSGDLEEESKKRYIAHNDFADINVLITRKEAYLIDFDDLSYNFPTVDVEQIFLKTARKGLISTKDISLWVTSYMKTNPLPEPLKELFIQRLALPTLYYRLLTSVDRGGQINEKKLLETIQWEKDKYRVLSDI
jgi:CotS family spore coat protein